MARLELIFLHSASGDGFDALRLLSMMRIGGRNACARTAITDLSPPGIESEFYFVWAGRPRNGRAGHHRASENAYFVGLDPMGDI